MTRAAGDTPYYEFVLWDKNTQSPLTDYKIEFPSVTHIISSVLAKPALFNWAYRKTVDSVAGYADVWLNEAGGSVDGLLDIITDGDVLSETLADNALRPADIRDESAERGTEKHALLETLAGLDPATARHVAHEWTDDVDPFASAIGEWWCKTEPSVVAAEAKLWSVKHGFAGTADLIWNDQWGNLIITDLKTGFEGRMKYDSDDIQTAAYDIAYREMTGAIVARRSVLIAREDGTHGEYTATLPTEVFLTVKQVYDMLFRKEVKRR